MVLAIVVFRNYDYCWTKCITCKRMGNIFRLEISETTSNVVTCGTHKTIISNETFDQRNPSANLNLISQIRYDYEPSKIHQTTTREIQCSPES